MNIRRTFTLIFIAGTALYAQGPRAQRTRTPPTPAQQAQRETNRLTRFFGLNAAQASTVLGILTTADTQLQALAPQIQALRSTLTAAIKSNSPSQISSTLQQLSSFQQQEDAARANAAAQIYATVLTTTQQGQVGTGLGPLMGGGAGFGPGGRGPGGFGPGRANRN